MSSRTALFLASGTGMFLFGIVLALLGTLFGLPQMRARMHIDLAMQGDLLLFLFGGVLVATVVVGPLIDRWGTKRVMVISALLLTLALLSMVQAQSFRAAVVSVILLGMSGGGLNVCPNALISDLYGEERGRMLNLLGVFYGVGALALPLLTASLATVVPVRQLLLGATALAAVTTLIYALLRFPPPHEPHGFGALELLRVARFPGVLLLGALLFFQSGNEGAIGGWTSAYLGTLGADARAATWVLSGYWAAMIVGRALAAKLLRLMAKPRLILLCAAGAFCGCVLLLFARSIPAAALASALIGVSFASIYPTTLAIAGDRYASFSGTVFGLLFTMGLLGGMSLPWAVGHLGASVGLHAGMYLPLVSAALIAALALLILLRDSARANLVKT